MPENDELPSPPHKRQFSRIVTEAPERNSRQEKTGAVHWEVVSKLNLHRHTMPVEPTGVGGFAFDSVMILPFRFSPGGSLRR